LNIKRLAKIILIKHLKKTILLMMCFIGLSVSECSFGLETLQATLVTPSVPAELLKENKGATIDRIEVRPGINEVIPIAMNHLNRLVLPFEEPEIKTVNPVTTQLEGRVLYIAPTDENPVTLYITPGKSEELALSLTLAPKHIPPREIHLNLDESSFRKLSSSKKMQARETSTPTAEQYPNDYVARLKALCRDIGLGLTPSGYALRSPQKNEVVHCKQTKLDIRTGQVLEGSDWLVAIAVAKNKHNQTIEIKEELCAEAGKEVLAISAWPSVRLEPQQSTEIIVVKKRPTETMGVERPSLLTRP